MTEQILMLAFDHDRSFTDLFGHDESAIVTAKEVVYDAFLRCADDASSPERYGILIDAKYGMRIAARARAAGLTVAMPIGCLVDGAFRFEEDKVSRAVLSARPAFAKALLYYNPRGDTAKNTAQREQVKALQTRLRAAGVALMLEFFVLPETEQLQQVDGDLDRYQREVRPRLILETVGELQSDGISPDVWKIEGIADPKWATRVGGKVRQQGDDIGCLVLGGGASTASVEEWLTVAGRTAGYRGFAVGRTIWREGIERWAADCSQRDRCTGLIADAYRRMVSVFTGAAGPAQ